MLEESVASTPSLWATMHSWFSPAVLFILLNLVIGTIAIISTLTSNKTPQQQQQQQQQQEQTHQNTAKPQNLTKSPSMLEILKPFNFYSKPQEEEPATPSPTYEQNPEINHLFSFPEPHEHELLEHGHELEGFHVHAQHLELGEIQEIEVEQEKEKPLSPRSPSILDKIKSFRLYSPISPQPTSPKANVSRFTLDPDQEKHEKEEQEEDGLEEGEGEEEEEEEEAAGGQSIEDEVYLQGHQHVVSRTKSDTKPTSGETLPKLSTKIRKSASEKSGFAHFVVEQDDNVENRRPASVKEGKGKGNDVDEEVDAKADDFINRFKHQLKLQRVESFTRYKEIINRGSGK